MSDPTEPVVTRHPMPTHPGTKPAFFTRLMLRGASRLGIRASDGIGSGAGSGSGAGTVVPGLAQLVPEHLAGDLYRTPSATNGRLWELMTAKSPWTEVAAVMAAESPLGRLGSWDYLITSAVTPLEGIQDGAHYLAAVGDAGRHTLLVVDDGTHVTISHVNDADPALDAANAARAYILGVVAQRLSEARQLPIVPVRVALAARAPLSHDALTELFGTRAIDFEQPVGSITFRTADLRAPGPYAQPGLSALLRRNTEHSLVHAIPLHSWLDLFRTTLACAIEEGSHDLTLAATAKRMTLSSRTLQRRLEEHGTTWRTELETVRREHITRLLETTDQTTDAIAARNGYADSRTLRRAVTRWTGHTPSELRRGALHGAQVVPGRTFVRDTR